MIDRAPYPITADRSSTNSVWRQVLRDIRDAGTTVSGILDPTSPGSGFGQAPRPFREILGYSFTIRFPRDRIVHSNVRPVDLRYAIANVIWVLTGSESLDMIATYNPLGYAFSDDGERLAGAAGPRLFGRPIEMSAFGQVVDTLKSDPTSRRAFIPVYRPSDVGASSRDVPCTADLQFFIREGELHCLGHMRSQSALGVLPYDLFLLTMIHEAVAATVGAPLGKYTHYSGSIHFYEDEVDLVESVIAETSINDVVSPMGEMPGFSEEVAEGLATAERARRNRIQGARNTFPSEGTADRYWTNLLSYL